MMSKLVQIRSKDKIVFIGDTHGDLQATKKILEKFLKPGFILVFLGDYVDRGPSSKENIDLLLKMKQKHPDQIYLLLGNHDAWSQVRCYPADFWSSLSEEGMMHYAKIFEEFPLVFSCGNLIATHGAIPKVKKIDEIENIQIGDPNWMATLWGDFSEGDVVSSSLTGRPTFTKSYFDKVMQALGKKLLIRAHQPNAPELMFDKHCLTIFTSCAYGRKRVVALADMSKEIKDAEDLEIVEI